MSKNLMFYKDEIGYFLKIDFLKQIYLHQYKDDSSTRKKSIKSSQIVCKSDQRT